MIIPVADTARSARARRVIALLMAASLSHPVLAQEAAAEPVTHWQFSGTAALVSDDRFRGISQSDNKPAVQAGLMLGHGSGAYAGVFASMVRGWGGNGGSDASVELSAGYTMPLANGTLDAGARWLLTPGGVAGTDYVEAVVKLSGTLGPALLLGGVAYAPPQAALGNWSGTAASRLGRRGDNLHLWASTAIAVPGSPLTLTARIGHSRGSDGLGPGGTSLSPTGAYADWRLGIEHPVGPLTLGLAYADTNIGKAEAVRLGPELAAGNGDSIAGPRLVVSLTAAF